MYRSPVQVAKPDEYSPALSGGWRFFIRSQMLMASRYTHLKEFSINQCMCFKHRRWAFSVSVVSLAPVSLFSASTATLRMMTQNCSILMEKLREATVVLVWQNDVDVKSPASPGFYGQAYWYIARKRCHSLHITIPHYSDVPAARKSTYQFSEVSLERPAAQSV